MKHAPTVSISLTTASSCTTRQTMHIMVSRQRRKLDSIGTFVDFAVVTVQPV